MSNKEISVAVLLTVYNRKEITIRGLNLLYAAICTLPEYKFDVFMVDDGCTDGSSELVVRLFPNIHIIKGDGNLYWGGGMNCAWTVASKNENYDFYLWFNDDAELYSNAIEMLFDMAKRDGYKSLVSGVFEDENHLVSYGGKTKDTQLIPLGTDQEVYYMNGNLVLVPRLIFDTIGMIDKRFIHGCGDYDYGLRAKEKGFKIRLTSQYVGKTSRHDEDSRKFYQKNYGIIERFCILYSPKYNPLTTFTFHLRHRGLVYATNKFVRKNIATMFPSIYSTLREKK